MRLTRLRLEEFRSYRDLDLDMPANGLRVHGRNASGKTSLLEAVFLLATTRSPRASLDRDMINWYSNQDYGLAPYARVLGHLRRHEAERDVEVVLTADADRPTTARKRVKLDGRPRRAIDVVGTLKVVLFAPEDLNLVLGSPSVRRRYLDISLSQVDPLYLQSLSQYGRLLEQRNSLLKELGAARGRRSADEELSYWDEQMTTHGSYLISSRIRYLNALALQAADSFADLVGSGARLDISYDGTVPLAQTLTSRIVGESHGEAQSLVRRSIERELTERRGEELRRGVTVVGPHRDDFSFLVDGRNLSSFGSRGQQRLAVVATKLAEMRQVVAIAGDQPVLLLDDVLSELDPVHRDQLLQTIGRAECQLIVTATDRDLLDQESLSDLPEAEVRDGTIHFS